MSFHDVYVYALGVISVLAGAWMLVLLFLSALIKRELQKRDLRPMVMGWRAFALKPLWGPTFRVLYLDPQGVVHAADVSLPNWHLPIVIGQDKLVGDPEPQESPSEFEPLEMLS